MTTAIEKTNFDLYLDVLKARREKGIPCNPDRFYDNEDAVANGHNGEINHPLVGRHLRDVETGEINVVKSAVRHWYWGWYTALLIEKVRNQSGCLIAWTSESCEIFAERAENNRAKFEVVP